MDVLPLELLQWALIWMIVHHIDLLATWKAVSIVFTGAFGTIGLLTEFRNKRTKKITRWGYISLGGIVISTILGTAAQLKESADEAQQALALARKSDRTLTNIQRSLSSISGATVHLTLMIPCQEPQNS